jgi:hypothetical protein
MKYFIPVIIVLLFSCSSGKENTSASADSTATVADSSTAETTTTAPDVEATSRLTVSHEGDLVSAGSTGGARITFTLPDSTTKDFQYEGNGYIEVQWAPAGALTFKSMSFSTGGCTRYSDEGTEMMLIDTLAVSDAIQFEHSRFDNRAAGTNGVQEIYDVLYNGNCVRFEWVFNWSYDATDEDRGKEFDKIKEFLKGVKFEGE